MSATSTGAYGSGVPHAAGRSALLAQAGLLLACPVTLASVGEHNGGTMSTAPRWGVMVGRCPRRHIRGGLHKQYMCWGEGDCEMGEK